MTARRLAARFGHKIGCGDNSCWFGRPGGMATNGGCRCWPRGISAANVTDAELQEMRQLVRTLATVLADASKRISELEEEIENLRCEVIDRRPSLAERRETLAENLDDLTNG